ncbi:MAG: Mth938-like domain-containing protein [Hyphomicrobiaceae bacterium]
MVTGHPQARYPASAPIDAYGNGGFRFAGMSHRGSILCLPDAIEAWDVADACDISPKTLVRVLARRADLDLVLLGTGESFVVPSSEVRAAFLAAGVGLEFMATGAAARTYNMLLGEGRRVAAALIAVDRALGT